jgi:molybdopterin-guanine dinucleotide biosynthesis protein B
MSNRKNKPPVISVVGTSGVGKTCLLEKLIPELTRRGFKVGTIKHHMHRFEMDKPGKDSWRHMQAGAAATMISSPNRIGMVMNVDHDHSLDELGAFLCNVDIILTEGYKRGHNPKIEVFRPRVQKVPLCKGDVHLLALVSDTIVDLDVPQFSMHEIEGLADLVIDHFNLIPAESKRDLEAAS